VFNIPSPYRDKKVVGVFVRFSCAASDEATKAVLSLKDTTLSKIIKQMQNGKKSVDR
jgi:hypothetical protein